MTQLLSNHSESALPTVPYSGAGLLAALPAPPNGCTDWPWTEETVPLPATQPNGQPWPKITIVTPSYHQGAFIEETIRSVLLQNYPNLEYIIMDGGSTDETVSVLEKYSNWISLWRSEPDQGQTHAINKGFQSASGFIQGYLNSDDLLLTGALAQVAQSAANYSDQPIIICGACELGYTPNQPFTLWCPNPPQSFIEAVSRDGGVFPQASTFWTQPANQMLPQFNERLAFCMDHDFWCQLFKLGYQAVKLDAPLAFFRHHVDAKSTHSTNVMWSELAGLPLLEAKKVKSFAEKLAFADLSRRRVRHYLRLEIGKILTHEGKKAALTALWNACRQHPDLLTERATLGLARRLLFATSKECDL